MGPNTRAPRFTPRDPRRTSSPATSLSHLPRPLDGQGPGPRGRRHLTNPGSRSPIGHIARGSSLPRQLVDRTALASLRQTKDPPRGISREISRESGRWTGWRRPTPQQRPGAGRDAPAPADPVRGCLRFLQFSLALFFILVWVAHSCAPRLAGFSGQSILWYPFYVMSVEEIR